MRFRRIELKSQQRSVRIPRDVDRRSELMAIKNWREFGMIIEASERFSSEEQELILAGLAETGFH